MSGCVPMVVLVGLVLAGCAPQPSDVPPNKRIESSLVIYTDQATGCDYLRPYNMDAGLTPRLDETGKPMCGARK